jgi:hypothetical protein
MVLNATFNNISVISWRSVLLVEETGENHRPVASHWQTLSHNVVDLALIEIRILDYEVLPIRSIDIINSQGGIWYLSYINDKICFNIGSETLRGINMENETCYFLLIYLCNQCLWCCQCTTLCDKVCQWLATGRWFSPGPLFSYTNKTNRHDITEILLKVALNTIK